MHFTNKDWLFVDCLDYWCRLVRTLSQSTRFVSDLYLSGIGLESSILFAQEGANVVLVDVNLENARKVATLISQRYPDVKVLATKADVGKEADVRAAIDKAVQEFGRLDVMVRSPG